jgi:hypothetical protein
VRDSFEYEEVDSAVNLNVYTKSPSKWLLLDRETGQVFQGNKDGYWDRLDPVVKLDGEDNASI